MFNKKEFRAALAKQGYTQKMLAAEIGMSEKTLIRKMSRGVFGTDEVSRITRVLDIKNPRDIFFAGE